MSDHFKYFLKPEERRSLAPKKKPTRKWNTVFILGNVGLLLLIIFLIYKPAMERLSDENNKFYIENFSVEFEYEFTQKGFFVDLYIFNEGEDRDFDFSKIICKIVFSDGTELLANNIKDKNELILKNTGVHYLLSYSIKDQDRLNQNFFIRILYNEKKVYESRTIDYGKIK